jgi:hypothetical protein
MIYGLLSAAVFMLSVAYVMYVLANKEAGPVKLVGQILAGLIVVAVLFALYGGATHRGGYMSGKGMMGHDMMSGAGMKGDKAMKCKMMGEMMKKDPSMMTEMCKDKDVKAMMEKCMKKGCK